MSWLRTSPLRQSITKNTNNRNRALDSSTECDPKACYDSFCKHWQQAFDIIQRSESLRSSNHDDVLGVVNHLDHMVTLILVELHHCNKLSLPGIQPSPSAPCLEFMLSENLLDKLYEWGIKTGRYANAVRLEQLKLYELLVSHSRHQLLIHEPFLRPLLKILASSQEEIFPPDVEKRLVILLNQLCVVLMQNIHLLDLFFCSTSQQQQQGHGTTNFILFSLLIPYVHREGSLGHQARDALLLCMALSQKNSNVGTYIAKYSSMSPVLVTGLGGLYSLLPNTIDIQSQDWYRITPDDVAEISELTLFMNSLEFCNAVVQVAHPLIQQQLLDYLYQGFLIPVLGQAILQTNIDSQISAMAYLEVILRSITEPGLLKIFVEFLLIDDKFDGERLIDILVERLNTADSRLCIVTLTLFDTLLSLNCEDIILELILKYLQPCQHIPILHRHKINKIDPYINSIKYFLDLTPELMKYINNTKVIQPSIKTIAIGANWNHYGINSGDTLYSNYYAYLIDARYKISQCKIACDQWSNNYKYQKMPNNLINNNNINNNLNIIKQNEKEQHDKLLMDMIRNFMHEYCDIDDQQQQMSQQQQQIALTKSSTSSSSSTILSTTQFLLNNEQEKTKQLDSLQSLGESSGYESFKYRPDDDDFTDLIIKDEQTDEKKKFTIRKNDLWKISNNKIEAIADLDLSEDLFRQGTVSLGPFLNAIWGKLQTFSSNCLYVNLHLTGLLTRMAWYPLPLIQSILLRPDIPTTSETPSFYQVLKILKQQMDAELPINEDTLELIDNARSQLVDREFRLINVRKNTIDTNNITGGVLYNSNHQQTSTSNLSATTPVQLTPSSSYDPFKRGDSKRRSITSSFSNIFRRPNSAGKRNKSMKYLMDNAEIRRIRKFCFIK